MRHGKRSAEMKLITTAVEGKRAANNRLRLLSYTQS